MSKELPYFRFYVSEWLNDDISLESITTKGVFIDVCSFYWFRDCSITKAMLEKRFSFALSEIKSLFDAEIIKQKDNSEFISISFLDKQYDELSTLRKQRQNAGRKGGKHGSSKPKAKGKQTSSYKDKDKDNNKDKELFKRTQYFWREVLLFKDKYSPEMLNKFVDYWTEPNRSKTKMRFELEKTFEIKRRLITWANRDRDFSKDDPVISPDRLKPITKDTI